MKMAKILIVASVLTIVAFAQEIEKYTRYTQSDSTVTTVGGFSGFSAFFQRIPDIIDTSFRLSPIDNSTDVFDPDFRLEHRNDRGRMRNYRGEIFAFFDGENYFIADANHAFGASRFRRLNRCETFSFFRRVQAMPAGVGGHSIDNIRENWVIIEHETRDFITITERVMRQFLIRKNPLLYREFIDRNRRGEIIDFIWRLCEEQ